MNEGRTLVKYKTGLGQAAKSVHSPKLDPRQGPGF